MSWFGGFFMGLFTRHLLTKLLALLLSIGFFLFVQANLTASQEIASIEIVPSLAEELRDRHVLLTNQVTFTVAGLTIRGEQSKVEGLARLYRSTVQRLPIDQRILALYGKETRPGSGVTEIPIDANLFRDDVLFGKDVTVERLETVKSIQVAELVMKPARVEVAPALQKLAHDDYEGQLTFAPNLAAVDIRGPKAAFEKDAVRIVVTVKAIGDRISTHPPFPGDKGTLTFGDGLCEIDWKESGIDPGLQSFLRIALEGREALPPGEFRQRLAVSCVATKRKETITLDEVPIQIRYGLVQRFDLLKHYNVLTPFDDLQMAEGWVRQRLKVRLPAAMKGDDAFLNNLVLVLDVATAKDGKDLVGVRGLEELGERLDVPYYLDVRDRSREGDLRSLRDVVIAVEDEPVAQFQKKS